MKIEKINPNIKYVYHYTLKKNVDKILNDKAIISKDEYVFFTKSLEDSISTFENEMMQEGKLYIDVNGILKKREKCNKDDYCILKIPYINDNKFYKFIFENQSKESIYTISITHKGAYRFEKAKVIEFPKAKKLNILTGTAVAAIATGIILFPYNSYAASWLDVGNYDTSWYTTPINDPDYKYQIDTKEGLAGFAYLVNSEQKTFEGEKIRIAGTLDLTTNTWQTISDIFKGSICGGHRIILNWLDGDFIKKNNLGVVVDYSFNVLQNNVLKKVNVRSPYTVKELKEGCGSTTLYSTVVYNDEILPNDKSLFELNLKKNDLIEVFTDFYVFVENAKGKMNVILFESGDSIENFKYKYSEKINIPLDKIIIKYNGVELKNDRTLADYNIQKQSTVQAFIKVDVNTNINENEGDIDISEDITTSEDKIIITIKPKEGYELDKIIINGIDKTEEVQNNELKIDYTDERINTEVTYKLKEELEDGIKEDSNSKNNNDEEPKEEIEKNDKNNNEGSKNEIETNDKNNGNDLNKEETKNNNVKQDKEGNNPQTGDNIIAYIITFFTSAIGIFLSKIKGED